MASQIANNTQRSLSLLTGATTLLLPPTFITGVFGTNVKGVALYRRRVRVHLRGGDVRPIVARDVCRSAPHGHRAVTRPGAGTAITVTSHSAHPRRLYHRNPS
jgi:hypothetical protein